MSRVCIWIGKVSLNKKDSFCLPWVYSFHFASWTLSLLTVLHPDQLWTVFVFPSHSLNCGFGGGETSVSSKFRRFFYYLPDSCNYILVKCLSESAARNTPLNQKISWVITVVPSCQIKFRLNFSRNHKRSGPIPCTGHCPQITGVLERSI